MAAGDTLAHVRPQDFSRSDGFPGDVILRPNGRVVGNPLGKGDATGKGAGDYTGVHFIPSTGAPLVIGVTLALLLQDDPENAGAGLVVRLSVSVKPMVTAVDDGTVPLAANEVAASVTINAVAGVVTTALIAIPLAKLNALAAGGWAMVRVRRLGSNSADTHPGRVLLTGCVVKDT